MAASSSRATSIDELLRNAELQHALYMRSMRDLYEALLPTKHPESPSSGAVGGGQSPGLLPRFTLPASSAAGAGGSEPIQPMSLLRPRRYTNDQVDPRRLSTGIVVKHVPASLYDDSSDDDNSSNGAAPSQQNFMALLPLGVPGQKEKAGGPKQRHLPTESFTVDQLVKYLKTTDFSEGTQIALHSLYQTRDALDVGNIFEEREDEEYVSATYEVYDVVGRDGTIEPRHHVLDPNSDQPLQISNVWDTIKVCHRHPASNVNCDGRAIFLTHGQEVNTIAEQRVLGRMT